MRNLPILFLLSLFLFGCGSSGGVREISVAPQGEFADIDVGYQNEVFERLLEADLLAVEEVLNAPETFNPPVLYALSNVLIELDRPDEAMFWFYTGQLRARSDANKSLDISARQGVSVLNSNFGTPINQYAFQDIEKLKIVVENVVEADRATVRQYDPRWIALHGMGAVLGGELDFEPESKWSDINESTRVDYLAGFHQAIESLQ